MNPVIAEISKSALRHNVSVVRRLAPNTKILAMIKANGYGHDAIKVAQCLAADVDAFGVARINEALELSKAGIQAQIVLMEGCFSQAELELAAQQNYQIVIQNQVQLDVLLTSNLPNKIKIWIKIDTGMHRVGFSPEQLDSIFNHLEQSNNVDPDITTLTHFAHADNKAKKENIQQFNLFQQQTKLLACQRSMANSAAIMTNDAAHFDWVRPGIMLYGSSPVTNSVASDYDLKPVMTLKSKVIALNAIKQGDAVGYGGIWQAKQDTNIAVVAMGYGDGYPRHAENGTPVLINGKMYPLVGRVSMDMITVDVGNDNEVSLWDTVTLWGEGLPAEIVAEHAETISYELFCNIANRVKKEFIE